MIGPRQARLAAIAACVVFWSASIVLAALRPAYSHLTDTVSELGARGTPNALLWNVGGFIVPGLLLAVAGAGIAYAVTRERSAAAHLACAALVLAGVAVAGQGLFPADMVDGAADTTSAFTRAHFVSSLLSGAAWAAGVLLLMGPMRRDPDWRGWHLVGVALVLLAFVPAIALGGLLPDGLAQRTGNAFFFAWYLLVSLKLVRSG